MLYNYSHGLDINFELLFNRNDNDNDNDNEFFI